MMLSSIAAIFSLLLSASDVASGAVVQKRAITPFTDFNDNQFFKPASNAVLWGTLYARSLQLPDESLLMTWENYPHEPPLVNRKLGCYIRIPPQE